MSAIVAMSALVPATASAARYVVENWNPSTGDWHANPNLDFIGWTQFNEDPGLLSLYQNGSQGHGLYGHSELSTLSNGAVAEWRYTPPGTSTVFKSEYEEATFNLAGCMNEGMRLKNGEWEKTVNEGPPFQERHASYHPTACGAGVVNFPVEGQLIVGNPGPQVFCAKEGQPAPCGLYNSPLENSAAFGIERFGLIQTPFSAYLRGIRVYETSYVRPYFTGATNTIEGWVHTGTGTITPRATETGMGMKTIRLTSPKRSGGTGEKALSSSCTGTRLARCPATWNKSAPAYAPGFAYSVEELPEGVDHFGVKAIDIVENQGPETGLNQSVVPPTKVDRTPPASLAATGELAELANQYINGQGNKTLGVSATDNLSGVRSLSLEDEGHGILASYAPASCKLTPLRENQCPLSASATLSVNTAQMPEGANHLRVVVKDLAGNVSYSGSWAVYVDRTAPGGASGLAALREPEEGDVALTWTEAPDPPLADGTPGSGASVYLYRYRIGEGAWSATATTQSREVTLPLVSNESTVSAEITAIDLVGNRGNPVTLSTTVSEADFTQENPGGYTGENLEEIGFSNAPEPEDPAWAGKLAQPETTNVPITPAAAFTENKCGSAPSPCGTYNGKEAAAYIRYWHKRRNSAYDSFGNDCVNFVNQALFAGGAKFERTDGFNDPTPVTEDYVNHYHKGEGSWWSARIYNFGPPEWHFTESWSLVAVDHQRIIENGLGYVLSPSARLKKGDIVFYRFPDEEGHFHSDRPWTHAAMISNITTEGVFVGQHTDDYERLLGDIYKKLDNEYHGPQGKAWFIQFVRPTKTMYNIG